MLRTSIIGALVLFLFGCAPWPYSYYLPSADQGTLTHRGPNLTGPADAIVLEEQGYDVTVYYRGDLRIQLFVPEGKKLLLNEPVLVVYNENSPNEPISFEFILDNYGFSTNCHEYVGQKRSNPIQRNGTYFMANINIGKPNGKFKVQLPSFEIPGGKSLRFSSISFEEKSGVAVMPIN